MARKVPPSRSVHATLAGIAGLWLFGKTSAARLSRRRRTTRRGGGHNGPQGKRGNSKGQVTGDKDSAFQFAGQMGHSPSGLQLAAFRAYDANLGRWISPDPIDLQGGINRFAYVVGKPTDAIDPLGLQVPVPPVDPITTGYDAAFTFFFLVGLIKAADQPAIPASATTSGPPTAMPPRPTTSGAPATPAPPPPPDPQGSSGGGGTPLSPEQEAEKNREHDAYHRRCDQPPPPGLCGCDLLRWQLQRAIDCI
jgi:RHS repeat-associated protein